ncbi:MAG TPA: LLM class flavin-dependent oxidoreductase [Candidatus Dormibacteraeota bacterium]|nr:LLM class flavin-dependent oxidoreductase [Candidatus Dormibacteraeota bacterium]
MKIGLGLPNSALSTPNGGLLVEFARRGESLGFSSLATIGRVAYPNYEELVTLAAAAGATERIGLLTDVLLGPTRDAVLLAKQAATLDQVSGGRFVMGAGVGSRPDDFAVTGMRFEDRGRRWDRALELMHAAWKGEPVPGSARTVCPRPVNGQSVPMIFGGQSDQAVARAVRYGIGYTMGGGMPDNLRQMAERVDAAWEEAGRQGRPEYRAIGYFALGDEALAEAERNLRDYYGDWGDRIWASALKDAAAAKERVSAFAAAGCDELVLFAAAPKIEQVERLAEAVL